MASKNRSYTLKRTQRAYELSRAIKNAITNNAREYLNSPIKNIGYKGILKASGEIIKWFRNSQDVSRDFKTTAMLMEKAGTGGALFKNLYRDFLKESADLLASDQINQAYLAFSQIAESWTAISKLFDKAGESSDNEYIHQASDILVVLAEKEKKAMELLIHI